MTQKEYTILNDLLSQVAALRAHLEEQEKHRTELREQDDHWRDRMETKTDHLSAALDELRDCIGEMPAMMDSKIAACHDQRVDDTRPAVDLARDVTGGGKFILKIAAITAALGAVLGGIIEAVRHWW